MVKTKFKHTDIGLIPEDWEVIDWMEVFDFKSTASYSRADLGEQGKIGYIHYGDIHTKIDSLLDVNKYVSGFISDDQLRTYSLINEGDLIIADASEDYSGVGKGFEVVGKPKIHVISGLHTFLVREKEKGRFAKGFKGYFHNNPLIKKQYNSLATGLKVYSLSKNSFQNIQIPLPPFAEQQAIVEVLSDTDRWIESLENLITKKQLIKQGAMQKLLTPKEDWEVKKIKEIAKVGRGRVISHKEINNSTVKKFPVYSSQTTNNGIMGYIDTYDFEGEYVTWTTDGEKAGTVFYRKGRFNCTNVCGTIKLLKDNPKFISYILGGITPKYVSKNVANPKLMNKPMKNIPIPLPPIAEQTKIASILSDMDAEIEILEQKLAKAQQIKQGLMRELLTGRRRLCGGFENLNHYADA